MVRAGSSSAQQGIMQLRFPLRETIDNRVYPFIQSVAAITITSSNVANVFNAFSFSLSQLDQVSSLIAVFDQYRIRMVEVEFLPGVNDNNTTATNTGLFTTVIDYDDSSSLTSFNQALDYSNALTGTGYEAQRRVFQPHAALAAYSGTFTSYGNVQSPWIDCSSTTVAHYGVKTAWTPTSVTGQIMTMLPKFWIEFRNVR